MANLNNPTVVIATTLGEIKAELFFDRAPTSVKNFLAYVESGHYSGTTFHRVIKDFMIQCGGLTADMSQKPTRRPIKNEAANGLKNRKGTLAMARTSVVNSATSQFFINLKDNPFLDHESKTPQGYGYAVFGRVIGGMRVVERIANVATMSKGMHEDVPVEPVLIERITVSDGNTDVPTVLVPNEPTRPRRGSQQKQESIKQVLAELSQEECDDDDAPESQVRAAETREAPSRRESSHRRVSCPDCASTNIQRVSVVYELGTQTGTTSAVGAGIGRDGHVVVGASSGVIAWSSKLAQRLSPPKLREPLGCLGTVLAFCFGSFGGVVALEMIGAGDAAAFALVIGWVFASFVRSKSLPSEEKKRQYAAQLATWNAQFICLRCGEVFLL